MLCAILPLLSWAQSGLHTDGVFSGKVVSRDRMVEVRVRGRTLSRYQLSYYHSVRFKATPAELATVKELFAQDRASAISTEDRNTGKQTTQIAGLPQRGRLNRYLCMMTSGHGRHVELTLVYMEGSVASISELRKLIN